jgi:hypothetical protein
MTRDQRELPPPPVHVVFHSRDLTSASRNCDEFLADMHGIEPAQVARMTAVSRSMTPARTQHVGAWDGTPFAVEYLCNEVITAEFHVLSGFSCAAGPGGTVSESDAVEAVLTELASTRSVFSSVPRAVRFVLPDRAPPAFSLLLHRMVGRFGDATLFVVVCTSTAQLDARTLSSFVTHRVPSPPPAGPPDRTVHAFLTALLQQTRPAVLAGRYDRVFDAAHAASFRLCGSLVTVDMLCRTLICFCSEHGMDDTAMRDAVATCAKADAKKHLVDKVSLVFDDLLMWMCCSWHLVPPRHVTSHATIRSENIEITN